METRKSILLFFIVPMGIFILAVFLPGKMYSIEKKNITREVLEKVSGYMTEESLYSIVYFTPEGKDYVAATQRTLDFYLPYLIKDFGLDSGDLDKVPVILYPDQDSMESLLGRSYDLPPMGVYYMGIIHVLSPGLWADSSKEWEITYSYMRDGPLIHECAHYLTDIKTGGKYPLWFAEGIALYYEGKYASYQWRPDLAGKVSDIDYSQLKEGFRDIDDGKAYRRAYEIIDQCVSYYGEDSLGKMMDLIRKGRSIDRYILALPNLSGSS